VFEVKFPVGKIGNSVRLRVAVARRVRGDPLNAITVTLGVQADQYYREEVWHNFSSETSFAFALRECLRLRKYHTARYLCGNVTGNCPYQQINVNKYMYIKVTTIVKATISL
jgi:hypothetical protein